MCGIAGIVSKHGRIREESLALMADKMKHRGPDDEGTWINEDRTVGLAHRRLSILDLSSSGRQPMSDPSGRIWITYNGEIYNFQELRAELEKMGFSFRSRTDTEVILHAYERWGISFLSRLNGMFAFGLYDCEKRRLYLARDRMGKKPLYYSARNDGLSFASECKTLLASDKASLRIDWQAVNFYFAMGYIPGSMSILEGVSKLGAGCYLQYDCDSLSYQIKAYWDLPCGMEEPGGGEREESFLEELQSLLEDSVRRRLIADVPVGILLSGGVDSSLVTAAAANVSSGQIKTFTIAFPESAAYNEEPYARLVAEHYKTEHHILEMHSDQFKDLASISGNFDEPFADPSFIPTYVVSCLTREYVKVALGGDGGDELFGGYHLYRAAMRAVPLIRRTPGVVKSFLQALVNYLPQGTRGMSLLRCMRDDLCEFVTCYRAIYTPEIRWKMYSKALKESLGSNLDAPEKYLRNLWTDNGDPVRQMTSLDLRTYLVDDILCKVDRASMATSLEVRAPWLDHRIVEFAMKKVPSRLKVSARKTRILQRALARKLLPRELNLNRKQGFVMPVGRWISGAWGERIEHLMEHPDIRDMVDRDFVLKMLADHRRGLNNAMPLFAILAFCEWYRAVFQK